MSQNLAIAALAYSVLRVYRMALGEPGGPAWEAAPQALKDKVLRNVDFVRGEKEAPSADLMHRRWVSAKMIDGWSQGPRSDTLKTHPWVGVPYEKLPREQQAKGKLFLELVALLAPAMLALDRAENEVQRIAQESLVEQQGALLYIAAMVNRFGGETGIVQLSKNDMHAALVCELMRHDTEDEGLLLSVRRPGAANDPVALDTTLPMGG